MVVPARVEGLLLTETVGSVDLGGCWIEVPASRLGQSPVDHQRLAILVEDDVARFQVAVQNSATVRVSHRVTHIHEPTEQPAQFQPAIGVSGVRSLRLVELDDRITETGPFDETHGIEGTSIFQATEAVNRYDAPMLEAPGHLGFMNEPGLAAGIVGTTCSELLEGHLAVEFRILGDPDLSLTAPAVGREEPESVSPGTCSSGGRIGGASRSKFGVIQEVGQESGAEIQLVIADLLEGFPDPGPSGHGRQAPLGVVAVFLEKPADQRIQQSIIVRGQVALRLEDLTQGSVFQRYPGLH